VNLAKDRENREQRLNRERRKRGRGERQHARCI